MKEIPKCPICKKRKLIFNNLYDGYSKTCGIYSCLKNTSSKEIEVYDYIKSLDNSTNLKFYLNNKEYDIKVKNLLIEFNGLFWHGDLIQKNKKYHYEKWKNAIQNNYELLTIWEDNWEYKRNIVKSMIRNKLNLNKTIFARKCFIKEITNKESQTFLEENHLQGKVFSKHNIGLFYNNELVSLMTFGKRKISSNPYYEMLRFCNKLNYSVIGGASKLLNYFLKKHKLHNIVSYANLDYSNGNLYEQLGFIKVIQE